MKKDSIEYIAQVITDGVITNLSITGAGDQNLYKATERILFNYKRIERLVQEYDFTVKLRSKDITSMANGGDIFKDKTDINDEVLNARIRSYAATLSEFERIRSVIKQFESLEEFIVIRMYYFNENVHGEYRGDHAERLTFEAISEQLIEQGNQRFARDASTLSRWRNRIVQDMTVVFFGVKGAVSVTTKGKRKKEQEMQA